MLVAIYGNRRRYFMPTFHMMNRRHRPDRCRALSESGDRWNRMEVSVYLKPLQHPRHGEGVALLCRQTPRWHSIHQPSRYQLVKNSLRALPGVLCVLLLSFTAQADDTAKLRQSLQKRLSEIAITDLKPAPVPGLYEMVFGTRVAYVSADGKYMLMGDLIDLDGRRNLTAMRRGGLVLKSIDALGEANMIVLGPAKPKRTLTVFTDVDCPYCARLHNEVPALTQAGVKVRYLLYPRAGKGSETYNRSIAVWCSKDRVKAIGIAKSGGKLDIKTCTNPVDEHVRLGREVGVEGTPTIVMDDGRVLPGYAPAAELLAALGLQDGKKDKATR